MEGLGVSRVSYYSYHRHLRYLAVLDDILESWVQQVVELNDACAIS
jgi:hypothetical protein